MSDSGLTISTRSEAEYRESRSQARLHKVAAACPFCGEHPGLARDLGPDRLNRFQVGCESDDCFICPQVSGETLIEAWSRWNKRAPVLTVVASNSDEVLAGAGGLR